MGLCYFEVPVQRIVTIKSVVFLVISQFEKAYLIFSLSNMFTLFELC